MMSPTARCPLCTRLASRVHSHYTRTIADLPWGSFIVRLRLCIRKFFCRFANCPRQIFAERVPELVAPFARRTVRQSEIIRLVGLAVGSRAGSRLTKRLQMMVSPSTMLRLLRQTPQSAYATPRVLGVDDFARRKGTTYGTILVDLEKHLPIEVLPSRSADALAAWLRLHPGIEIITRDRSTEYTRGITEGAPQAIQVADRFHILCNLRDALERVLDQNRAKLSAVSLPRESGTSTTPTAQQLGSDQQTNLHQPEELTTSEMIAEGERRLRRQHLYEQVRELHAQRVSIRAIAKQLELSRMTVYRYLRLDTDPTQLQRCPRHSMIDPFIPYLCQRWHNGCQNGGQLWNELRALGYPGSRKMLTVWVGQQRKKEGSLSPYRPKKWRNNPNLQLLATQTTPTTPTTQASAAGYAPSSRRLAWFLVRDPKRLNMTEQAVLAQVKEICQDASTAYQLVHNFHRIVKGRLGEELNSWLKAAVESCIPAMQNFAAGIEKDKAAILAALTHEWSNGQVEGQVNRIKLRKRQLYGRANFDLLRVYVLNDL
jgi:transposase